MSSGCGVSWAARWAPALVVALGAAVATAHGLYEVAHASKVPGPIAWLYPLVTDGLAMVAYSATGRLSGKAAGYAWTCVVLAAGLSGLAQAVYLAADTVVADPVVRFGVGAWPAIACALVAHLLHLILATDHHGHGHGHGGQDGAATAGAAAPQLPAPLAPEVARTPEASPVAAHDDDHDDQDDARDETRDGSGDEERPGDEHDPGELAGDGAAGDVRVRLLGELLAAGEDVTGPQAAALLSHQAGAPVSDRTARRLLATARDTAHEAEQEAEPSARRARLVLLPTGTTTSTETDSEIDTDEGDPR